jgi:triosephosphate isomerase
MRVPIVAGNWKMNTTAASCADLCDGVRQGVDDISGVEKVVCPPFPFLFIAHERLRGSSVKVGAQNMHWAETGAYTGEVSHSMLAGVVEYVIIGHSERRAYFGETDETVNKKLAAALAAGLKPIFCIGETESEREAGRTEEVLLRQVRIGLEDIRVPEGFAIAYEPVWAIGTGKAATGAMANEAIGLIRAEVARQAGSAIADSVRILYGGSVTPDNVTEFARQPEIDGGLVGGASLNADSFVSLVRQTAEAAAANR